MLSLPLQTPLSLPGSNWSTLHGSDDTVPYTSSSFLSRLPTELTHLLDGEPFSLVSVTSLADDDLLSRVSRLQGKAGGRYAPLLTLHAAAHPDTVAVIARTGYCQPGERTESGGVLPMRNGALYGHGVYTAGRAGISACYGFEDNQGNLSMLVNLVVLGKVRFLNQRKSYAHMVHVDGKYKWVEEEDKDDHEEWDTVALPDMSIVVSAVSERVVPVAIVQLKRAVPSHRGGAAVPGSGSGVWVYPTPFSPDPTANPPAVRFSRLAGDLYTVTMPVVKGERPPPGATRVMVHHILAVSAKLAADSGAVRVLSDLVGSLSRGDASAKARVTLLVYGARAVSEAEVRDAASLKVAVSEGAKKVAAHGEPDMLAPAVRHALDRFVTKGEASAALGFNLVLFAPSAGTDASGMDEVVNEGYVHVAKVRTLAVRPVVVTAEPGEKKGAVYAAMVTCKALHTDPTWENHLIHVAHDARGLSTVTEVLIKDAEAFGATVGAVRHAMRTPYPLGVLGTGFFTDLSESPKWDVETFTPCLFKGRPPPHMWLQHPYEPGKVAHPVVVVEGIDTQGALENAPQVLAKFRNFALAHRSLFKRFAPLATQIARAIVAASAARMTALLAELGKLGVPDASQSRADAIRAELASLRTLRDRVASVLADLKAFAGVTLEGPALDRLLRLKFARDIVKRAAASEGSSTLTAMHQDDLEALVAEALKEGREVSASLAAPGPYRRPRPATLDDLTNAMALCELRGWRVTLFRTNASAVEPWLILVGTVEPAVSVSFSDVFRNTEFGGDDGTDIVRMELLPPNDMLEAAGSGGGVGPRAALARTVLTYLFLRVPSPSLFIASMPVALVTVAWCRLVESIIFPSAASSRSPSRSASPVPGDQQVSDPRWADAAVLREAVASLVSRASDAMAVLDGLAEHLSRGPAAAEGHEPLEKLLTETHGIKSVCLLLGALATARGGSVLRHAGSPVYSRLAFALLAEAVMRGARAYLRAKGKTAEAVIREVLGITEDSEAATYALNMDKAARVSGRAFLSMMTLSNCTPFCVVAVLGHLEGLAPQAITMRGFLERHAGGCTDGKAAQVALFLEGCKYTKASGRVGASFSDPRTLIQAHADAQLKVVEARRALAAKALGRVETRREERRLRAEPFLGYHSAQPPRIFTPGEIDEMNLKRAKDDQLQVHPTSKLLLHHCSYPSCPDFLTNFATRHDRATGKTRNGLFRHLALDGEFLGNRIPGFHMIIVTMAREAKRAGEDYSLFVDRVWDRVRTDPRGKRQTDLSGRAAFDRDVAAIWAAAGKAF
jgi:hypothetical protein